MAMDDALIAVFDAKYTYNFWRPVTAIRNGDIDGNDATDRDPGWTPFIDTPMHPEYPCAHCIVSASLGAVLAGRDRHRPDADAELGQLDRRRRGAHLDERRRLHAGGRDARASTTACTTATRRRSAPRWARRSASSRRRACRRRRADRDGRRSRYPSSLRAYRKVKPG